MMVDVQTARNALYEEDGWTLLEDRVTNNDRWSIYHEAVAKDKDGKCWMFNYSEGATEMQCQSPFEYEEEVEFTEVEKRLVAVEKWMPVDQTDDKEDSNG